MQIGGFQKLSLIDYPGKMAAVIFTQGCNFRCPFCHNRDLVLPEFYKEPIAEEEVYTYLRKRQDKLQGLVITGGEPTLQVDLVSFLRRVKDLGYSIKVDSNGSRPEVLEKIILAGLVDYIAMDVKSSLASYGRATGVAVDITDIQRSIELLLSSNIDHHFRTTAVKPIHGTSEFQEISSLIQDADKYIIQEFVAQGTVLDNSLLDRGHYSAAELASLRKQWERHGVPVGI